jgi:hypothetical protein
MQHHNEATGQSREACPTLRSNKIQQWSLRGVKNQTAQLSAFWRDLISLDRHTTITALQQRGYQLTRMSPNASTEILSTGSPKCNLFAGVYSSQ